MLRDEKIRREYSRIYSGHLPVTVAAYEDILKMLALVSTRKWYRSVNEDIPILLLGGKRILLVMAERDIGNCTGS